MTDDANPLVEIPKSFRRRLRKKSHEMQGAIARCIETLLSDPQNNGLAVHPVEGSPGVWEAKVDKGNRITFEYGSDRRIILRNHCNHDILRRNP
jgi:hypothetical protein